MDPDRFDALVQSFAHPGSRRRLFGGLLAGSLAPLTAAAKPKRHRSGSAAAAGADGPPAASAGAAAAGPQPAACLPIGKRCSPKASGGAGHGKGKGGKGKHHPPSCSKCCSRHGAAGPDGKPRCTCKSEGIACDGDSQCCSGQCRTNVCTGCPPDQVFCPDGCANLQTDANHCGACTTTCGSGQRCVNGTCVCDETSCSRGCCAQDGTCQRGTSDQACGINGAACQACPTCTTCDGTTCVNATACCGAAAVCQRGTCQDCAAGQRCQDGTCICDATSCPNGCCNGSTCVPIAQQTKQQCGTGGAACQACTGNDTCGGGNPGTPGVCGCTRQCDGKTCGDDDTCGGTCTACPDECQTCDGSTCRNKPDGADCGGAGSGLHCCNGVCPSPTCLPNDTCCGQGTTCTQCCGFTGYDPAVCPMTDGYHCQVSQPGQFCISDSGCDQVIGAAMCVCGTCCLEQGGMNGECPVYPDACCSGACNGIYCA